MVNEGKGGDNVLAMEARLRCVHEALKLRQPSPEATAAMKRLAKADLDAYETALREHGAH